MGNTLCGIRPQSSKSGAYCRMCGSGLARNAGRRARSGAGWCHGRVVERLRGSTPSTCQNDIGALAAPARPVLSKLSAGLIMRDGACPVADIFVSYSRQDRPRVAPLVAALEAQGWSVWWDPEIVGGQEFDRQICRRARCGQSRHRRVDVGLGRIALGARRGARGGGSRRPGAGAHGRYPPADRCARHSYDRPG